MTLEGFAEDLKRELYRRMEEGSCSGGVNRRIEYRVIQKNNGVRRHGILVMEEKERVIPYIYVERYLEEYEGGRQLQDIASEIEEAWGKQLEEVKEKTLEFSFEAIQDKIVYYLVHYERNREWLEQVPHLPFLDLALTFHVTVFQREQSYGSVPIQNKHLEKWDVDLKELCRLAAENTPKLFPEEIRRLEDVLEIEPVGIPMYLISNTASIHGAAAVLYPSVLSALAKRLDGSFYLLPSSIHEFIAVPFKREYAPEELREIVREVNESQVEEEEYLSDQIYYYDRDKKVIVKVDDSSFL